MWWLWSASDHSHHTSQTVTTLDRHFGSRRELGEHDLCERPVLRAHGVITVGELGSGRWASAMGGPGRGVAATTSIRSGS